MDFEPQENIVLMQKQLHGNTDVLLNGQIISIEGNSATVIVEGEEVPRSVSLDRLQHSESVYGDDLSRPGEHQVIDAIRR